MKRWIAKLAAAAAATALVVGGVAVVGTSVSIPAPAAVSTIQDGVVAEAIRADGSEEHSASEAATPGTATQPRLAGTPGSCADGAYSLSGYKVNGSIRFGYNP